jgi:hypothetical protein
MEPIVETAASPLNVDVSMRESACGHSGIDHGAGVADNDESNGGSPVSGSDSESCGQHTEQLPSEGSPGNCDDEEEDGASSTDGSDSDSRDTVDSDCDGEHSDADDCECSAFGSDSESCGQHTEQLPSEGSPGNCDEEEEDGASSTDGSDSDSRDTVDSDCDGMPSRSPLTIARKPVSGSGSACSRRLGAPQISSTSMTMVEAPLLWNLIQRALVPIDVGRSAYSLLFLRILRL